MKKVIMVLTLLVLLTTPAMARLVGRTKYVYRMYNPFIKEHLWTTDENEAVTLSRRGWQQDTVSWFALIENGKPIYRLYNAGLNDHLYTNDENEVAVLKTRGWTVDNSGNPLFYSGGSVPIYRLYLTQTKRHLLTSDQGEYNYLGNQGWQKEGVVMQGAGSHVLSSVSNSPGSIIGVNASATLFTDDNGNYQLGHDFN